jgi:hypothetical protein
LRVWGESKRDIVCLVEVNPRRKVLEWIGLLSKENMQSFVVKRSGETALNSLIQEQEVEGKKLVDLLVPEATNFCASISLNR